MKQERNSENVTDTASISFTIKGAFYGEKCFPGLNDMLHEAERHPKAYNDMKRQYQLLAVNAIRRDLRGFKAKGRVQLNFTFGEPLRGNKRDFDNIVAAGRKIITDALVRTNILEDDSPRYLGYGTNNFEYVDVPYIRVEIVKIG